MKDIYAQWLALELIKKGHSLKKIVQNPKNDKYLVFVFYETEELINDMVSLTVSKQI